MDASQEINKAYHLAAQQFQNPSRYIVLARRIQKFHEEENIYKIRLQGNMSQEEREEIQKEKEETQKKFNGSVDTTLSSIQRVYV